MRQCSSHPGLTLIETLAALVILAAAALVALGLLQSRTADPTAHAANLRAALERARLLAITEGGGTLIVSNDGVSMSVDTSSNEVSRTRRVLNLPRPWSIARLASTESLRGDAPLVFDHAGRSADANFELLHDGSPALRLRWLGIAGQLVTLDHEASSGSWGVP